MASNIITMTRGDSYVFDVTLFDEWNLNKRWELESADTVYFGLMFPHQKFEDAILRKRYVADQCKTSGRITIRIAPEDTVDLEPGVYYYAIKVRVISTNEDGEQQTDVVTVVNKTKFIIND